MWLRLMEIEEENDDNVDSILKDEVSCIYKVDISLSDKVYVNVSNFKVSDEERDQLCGHMLVSRMIAQISLNLYNNYHYYKDIVSYNQNLLKQIEDKDSRNVYGELLGALKKGCPKENLFLIIKRSIIIYLAMFSVLKRMEIATIYSNHDKGKNRQFGKNRKQNAKENITLYSNVQKSACYKGEFSNFKNTKEKVVERWTCGKCTILNVYEDELCKACGECGPHREKWRCGQCTMINDKLKQQCGACDRRNPYISICPRCHLKSIYNKVCLGCLDDAQNKYNNQISKRNKKGNDDYELQTEHKSVIENVEEWLCLRCSKNNSFEHTKCYFCHNVGPHYHKWRCNKCTFFNPRTVLYCKCCGVSSIKKFIKSYL